MAARSMPEKHHIGGPDQAKQARAWLDRASECRRWANRTSLNERTRETYLQLARSYEMLAGETDRAYAREIWRPH